MEHDVGRTLYEYIFDMASDVEEVEEEEERKMERKDNIVSRRTDRSESVRVPYTLLPLHAQ